MSIFDGIEERNGVIINNNWVCWYHTGIPLNPDWLRSLFRMTFLLLGHCMICTGLSGCLFLERKMPKLPYHEKCHCTKMLISQSLVKNYLIADCAIEKFTNYVFSDKSNGKKELFESWGFNYYNSNELKVDYEKQAIAQYLNGNYILKNIDMNGQRIAIPITLNGKTFYSGWIVEPGGKLRNTTPFGGWINE